MSIRDWSQTAASNTSLEGITVAEGLMNISDFNNVLRAMAAAVREVQANSTIASASTVNIGAANAEYLAVSGTTTITAFDTVAAGVYRVLKFDGILTLTHNGTSLILPSAANITTAAGDVGGFRSLGSGNWRCEWFQKASGAAVVSTSGTVTSVATGTGLSGGTITATGTIALDINGLTTKTTPEPGTDYAAIYSGDDTAPRKSLVEKLGRVVQRVYDEDRAYSRNAVSSYTQVPNDDTKPAIGEGVEILSVSITPTSATNIIRARAVVPFFAESNGSYVFSIHRAGDSLASSWNYQTTAGALSISVVEFEETSPGTSSVTYTVRMSYLGGAQPFQLNGIDAARKLGGAMCISLVVEEIVP